jgi:hypothetical protein
MLNFGLSAEDKESENQKNTAQSAIDRGDGVLPAAQTMNQKTAVPILQLIAGLEQTFMFRL